MGFDILVRNKEFDCLLEDVSSDPKPSLVYRRGSTGATEAALRLLIWLFSAALAMGVATAGLGFRIVDNRCGAAPP